MSEEAARVQPMSFTVGIHVSREMAECDDVFAHTYLGRHRRFTGRPYRRGKGRCSYCGAPQVLREVVFPRGRTVTKKQAIRQEVIRELQS